MQTVVNDVVSVANRYGLGDNYASSHGGGFARQQLASRRPNRGHLLQIFIHKDIVNDVTYRSQPMGIPVPASETQGQSVSDFLRDTSRPCNPPGNTSGPCCGQSRIFMHPTIFTDLSQTRIYHYAANEEYMSAEGGRTALLHDLEKALSPILGNAEGLRKALNGVEGRASI